MDLVIGTKEEMGRELTAADLTPGTVVILGSDTSIALATAWVQTVNSDLIGFHFGEVNVTFLARRMPDDTLRDYSDKHIRVFEYLGEI
ncbi:MAG TPA: hypothetical protein VK638_44490 [Edaphobacter sp.]|nr:hypothetical protein [Edaphobacter sp.]